ncbi:hypothetical protein M3I54_22690 [Paraburkholderia sp. CNPSo 3274]|uniref:hypothetical protein n=1 Tax=Paraburkholderia sp. CNPSo 3274 TaxID=2940932 RepID=UPI0020B70BF3|nr:hypothetical protein [Paraburkholderia sp. CNPSo 3274]MCP3709755.1 hypothetical protein [Paraburkholderia sp. CNPSo 3274]
MKKTIQRHELTAEEQQEVARLRAAWESFKANNPGATQEWLGAEAKIGGQSAVGQYLRGVLALNFATLMKLCAVLKVSPSSISPRLVEENLGDHALDDDLFVRTTRASGRLEKRTSKSAISGQDRPLSSEAAELIRCVARLDRDSDSVRKNFKLVTALLLLAVRPNESQDMRTAEELIGDAERAATEILTGIRHEGLDEYHRKNR